MESLMTILWTAVVIESIAIIALGAFNLYLYNSNNKQQYEEYIPDTAKSLLLMIRYRLKDKDEKEAINYAIESIDIRNYLEDYIKRMEERLNDR